MPRILRCWQCDRTAERHTHTGDGYEIRHQENGLDEVIAKDAHVHLERMDDHWYWLGIDLPDGTHLRVTVGAVNERSHVQATVEIEARKPGPSWLDLPAEERQRLMDEEDRDA